MVDSNEIKERLKLTYYPFFGHFGNFTPVQILAIPHILDGENIILISPAATGKTEAVIAPIIENLLLGKDISGIKVLYVSPTRALVNDLYRRLEEPVKYLNLTIERKTGDHPLIDKKNLPNILLTTPESFDSLLTRETKIFLNLKSVILDEIHLLDNTPRGDQLRILLNRLKKINKNIQYCALSATIDDLTIRNRYFDNAYFLILKEEREIEYKQIQLSNFTKELFEIIKAKGLKKILVFFNSRSLAEEYSKKLNNPPFQGKVLIHHASLPKSKREQVEKAMSEADSMILLSTSTLEIGIDIGDIDCVALIRPPFSVSSLLQRIGRGNRRTDKLFSLSVCVDYWEKILFEVFFESAKIGRLYTKTYMPSLSIVPQQIYSYLHQRRRIGTTLKSVIEIFKPIYDEETIRNIFAFLIERGFIREIRGGIYYISDKLEKKIKYGKIHSNIAEISYGEYEVHDIANGEKVGRIYYPVTKFILSGKSWEKIKVSEKEKKVYARLTTEGTETTKIFEGKGSGNYNYLLSPAIKHKFFPELKSNEFPFMNEGKDIHILHFLGSIYGFLVANSFDYLGIKAIDVGGKILILKNFELNSGLFPVPPEECIRKVISENIMRLEDALGSGAYFYDLPVEFQIEDLFRALDITRFLQYLNAIKLFYVKPETFLNIVNIINT